MGVRAFTDSLLFATRKGFKSYRADMRGNVTTLFVVLAPAILLATGGAFDYSRAQSVRADLQLAVDAAVLAAASDPFKTDAELEEVAEAVFNANMATDIDHTVTEKEISVGTTAISYTAVASVPTTLSRMAWVDEILVDASSIANPKTNGTEIVIALDTTGSMGFGNSWNDAKAALGDILVDLDAMSTNNSDFYATVFPFADRVNVGETRAKAWLSVAAPPNGHWGNKPHSSNTNKWCLEPRDELVDGNPNTLTDKSPSDLAFLPSAKNYWKSYLMTNISYGVCPADGIMGPSTNISSFQSAIENLPLKGTGRFDVGMAWAYRLLSPNWQGEWGVAGYPSAYGERRKIAIFISDAYTEAYRREVDYQTTSTQNPVLGWNQGSVKGFENFVAVCEQMKAAGIEVHTIYVNGNNHGVPYMKSCSTSENGYYHAVSDIDELRSALQDIANTVVSVGISK